MFTNEIVWSADVTPIGQGINGPGNFLVAVLDIIFLCVTVISMCLTQDKLLARFCFHKQCDSVRSLEDLCGLRSHCPQFSICVLLYYQSVL